jgi:glycine/D-amino acid oxidase-like deaminating enzyme
MGMQGFGAMVHNQYEGCLHSGKLLDAMSALVQDCGVQVLYGTPVEAWQATGSGWMVKAGGRDFESAQLVLATNAWLSTQVPDLRIKPARGQVIVTKPLPGLQLNGTFHFDEGFYYWRHLPGGRILLGGARNADFGGEETLDTGISQSIQHKLETFLLDHFPQYFTTSGIHDLIDHRWSGFMAMSPDKMPVLAQPQPGLHVAMCCNGMGVALAPVHAEAVAQAVIEQA